MILCVGEILCDMTGSAHGGKTVYEQNAGGAPFNVACGLKKLGTLCGFCGNKAVKAFYLGGNFFCGAFCLVIFYLKKRNFKKTAARFLTVRRDIQIYFSKVSAFFAF